MENDWTKPKNKTNQTTKKIKSSKKNKQLWKTTLAVWSPILALIVIYMIVYVVKYVIVNNTYSQHKAQYDNCENNYQKQETKHLESMKTTIDSQYLYKITNRLFGSITTYGVPQPMDCEPLGTIEHGFLGLPYFTGDNY